MERLRCLWLHSQLSVTASGAGARLQWMLLLQRQMLFVFVSRIVMRATFRGAIGMLGCLRSRFSMLRSGAGPRLQMMLGLVFVFQIVMRAAFHGAIRMLGSARGVGGRAHPGVQRASRFTLGCGRFWARAMERPANPPRDAVGPGETRGLSVVLFFAAVLTRWR
jgi:hypothetical protein